MARRATALVERLYVRRKAENGGSEAGGGTYIRLALPESEAPLNGYFTLELSHENYYALYSLALTAAINRYPLQILAAADINPAETAIVEYMVVDW